jgi:hypothetical protein
MLSHEPKNYALLGYDGRLLLRGVAFRSSRAEPFAEAFLRRALGRLLAGDVPGVRSAYADTVLALRGRAYSTYEVSSRVRLTRSAAQYRATRAARREHAYEAMLAAGRTDWRRGERVRVFRTRDGSAGLALDRPGADARDYDVEHYLRVLRDQYATRLARAFAPADFAALFSDPGQESLFPAEYGRMRTVLQPT